MHFGLENDDRRNDRWVPEHWIKLDNDEVERQRQSLEQAATAQDPNGFMYCDHEEGFNERWVQEFRDTTRIKSVESIYLGKHHTPVWYFAPLPKEYHCKCLYICDFCLNFFVSKKELSRHSTICKLRSPPGDMIYRDDDIAFFEVNGS